MIGKLDQRIWFYDQDTGTTDRMGGNTGVEDIKVYERWANITEKPVNPLYQNNQITHLQNITMVIRLDRSIKPTYKVLYRDVYYIINYISHDQKYTYIKSYGAYDN